MKIINPEIICGSQVPDQPTKPPDLNTRACFGEQTTPRPGVLISGLIIYSPLHPINTVGEAQLCRGRALNSY